MPIYEGRKKGTWRVVLWSRGKSHEWVVKGLKRDAEKLAARKRVELATDPQADRASITFSAFLTGVYVPHAERHLASSTWKTSRIYQIASLSEFFGKTRLDDLRPKQIEDYKARRLEDRTPRGGRMKPSSINNELRVLKTVLRFAADQGYAVTIPKWKRLPERGNGRISVWTTEELQRLFEGVRQECPDLLAMVVFLANTGCRKGEALACEWSWIDTQAGLLRIPSNEYWQPKNGLPREVPIANAVRAWLAGPPAHERWVFPASHGDRYHRFPEEQFRRARLAAGLPNGGPHRLRHTFASHFLQSCQDMFLLAKLFGHSTTRVTELYSHLLPGHLERAKNAVDLAPPLQTMATAMAPEKAATENRGKIKKIATKRH